jgi:hypothetical protein
VSFNDDLTFMMIAHEKPRLVMESLFQVRGSFLGNRILLILDGVDFPLEVDRFCLSHMIELKKFKQSLYQHKYGGGYWKRHLNEFLWGRGKYLVKIDPDTKVFRPFLQPFVDADAWGCLAGRPGQRHIQGGCQVLTRDLCQEIFWSGILDDKRLTDPDEWCSPKYAGRFKKTGALSEDKQMNWIQKQLKKRFARHPEIFSVWQAKWAGIQMTDHHKQLVENKSLNYAITHPHSLESMKR